jgi:hypothetical protein
MSVVTGRGEVRVWETKPDEVDLKDAVRDKGEIGASPAEVANVSVEKAVQTLTPVVGQPDAYVGGDGKTYVASSCKHKARGSVSYNCPIPATKAIRSLPRSKKA